MADDSSQSPAIARKASAPKLASQGSAPGLKGAAKLKLAGKLVAAANQIADTAHAIQCTAHGPGLTGYIAQQIPVTFTIQAAGDGGAPATKGGHDFRVTVRGLDRVEPTMTDKGDGTYVVRLTYPMSGKYEVRVTLERSQIKGSPFEVTVRAAGRPAAPPQPSFGSRAAGRDVLEWAEPEHTGGCPLLSYSVWKLPKTNWQPGSGSSTSIFRPPSESEYELLATLDGEALRARRYELPPLEAGERRSSHFNRYALSCVNSKGESERGPPGPAPVDDPIAPFDASRVEAEGQVLLKRWDKEQEEEQDARFWFLLGGYRSKKEAEKGLDEAEGNLIPAHDTQVHRCVLRRLQAAATTFVGCKMVRRDVEMAIEHAEHVARLQHALQQTTDKAAGKRPTAASFLATDVPSSDEAAALVERVPPIRQALQALALKAPDAPLTAAALEQAVIGALPRLPVESAASNLAKGSES